jgi:biopolymer transport protein ExbD
MKIRSFRKTYVSLDSVAMTDIVMNMFIFFFVSFSLLYTFNPVKESKIKVNLPGGVTNYQKQSESPIIVSVTAKNDIYIGNKKTGQDSLMKELSSLSQSAKKNGLVIKSDRQSSVDKFVNVLDAAKQAGIDKLSVSIELHEKKP